ncbi:MAG: hypothetical protein Q8R37_01150, partial [Nanoarchaeota archaeon]|nr:hypothetical protein [Nanoarchaeota archaeon]
MRKSNWVIFLVILVLFAHLVSPFMLPILDNFEREVLGGNWTQVGGNLTIQNGKLKTFLHDSWGYYNRV